MAEDCLKWAGEGRSLMRLLPMSNTRLMEPLPHIMVDDLNHLVKGGRLSNGAAILGNLLSIKPILHFNDEGVIEVFEKVRTEKKAMKTPGRDCCIRYRRWSLPSLCHPCQCPWKAEALRQLLIEEGVEGWHSFATFGGVIGTHLGDHSLAVGYIPIVCWVFYVN